MLVLSRKPKQAIMIGDVRVYVASIQKGIVRLAIDGPRSVPIVREELLNKEPEDVTLAISDRT